MRIARLLTGGIAALLLAACATAPKAPAVAPAPPPPPAPLAAPPQPAPPPASVGWEDMPLTPGDWRFAAAPAAEAAYGEGAAAAFTMRCDMTRRQVLLLRPDAGGSALTIRTTFGARQFPSGEGGAAALPATDSFLDGIVSSRGRFAVEASGLPALILPTWPEPARVVEECRS